MKKISLFFICLFTILIASCSFNEIIETINETEFNITYHLNNDEKNYVDTTAKDEFYTFKTNFERENCVLEGWYYDEFLQTKCPGSIQINGDMDVCICQYEIEP